MIFLLFIYLFLTSYHIRLTVGIQLTKYVEVKPLDSSANMILNGAFTPIRPHSSSPPSSALTSPFGLPSSSPSPISQSPYSITPSFILGTIFFIPCLNHHFRSTVCIHHYIMAPRASSKGKGKEVAHDDSPPPRFDRSTYPSQEASDRYSTRTITSSRVINFEHLSFMGFNQTMRRMTWLKC